MYDAGPLVATECKMIKLDQKEIDELLGQNSAPKSSQNSVAAANIVIDRLEDVLAVISRQESFLKDIIDKYDDNPESIHVNEVLNFINDNLKIIEKHVFRAKAALEDGNGQRQKLIKVKDTLGKLYGILSQLLDKET